MQSLPQVNIANKYEQFNYGYNLYVARQAITRCTNEQQRAGWRSAQVGELGCVVVDAVFAAGGNAEQADRALAGGF